jgi:hypothetical protein
MERVYAFLGLDIAAALPALEAYQRRTGSGKRRRHEYSLEEFGLDAGRVAAELDDYVDTYRIAREARVRIAM